MIFFLIYFLILVAGFEPITVRDFSSELKA